MLKLIVLVLGLAIGFGVGVYWAHHNPDAAAKLSAEEEERFLEAQLAITEKIQAKLEELKASASGKVPGGASGFLSSSQSKAAVVEGVDELKSETQTQADALRKRLAEIK